MLKIKYVPVENCEAEWGDKMALIKRFEGLKLKTLNNLLTEMRLLLQNMSLSLDIEQCG